MVDNVLYVVWLSPLPRRFGWSQGPDTPDEGGQHDWPPQGDTDTNHIVHWIDSNGDDMPDTDHNLLAAFTSGQIKKQMHYAGETTGVWLITDMSALIQLIRDRGLNTWADFLEASPRIPRVGDPS